MAEHDHEAHEHEGVQVAEHEHHHEHDHCECGCEHEHHHEHCDCGCEHEHHHEHHHEHDHCDCGCEHDHDHHDHTEALHELERELVREATFRYHVLDIDCPNCARNCQNAIRNLECVEDARLIYATSTLEVVKKPEAEINHCRRHVLETVRSCGQDLELTPEETAELEAERSWWSQHREAVLMGVSGVLHAELAANVAFVISALAGLVFVFPMAMASLRRRTADMNVLMSVAVIGGLAMGAFGEAAMVIFLDQVGEWLEGWSMRKTAGSIQELVNLAPKVAHVVGADGTTTDVPLAQVEEGQTIRIFPGERVPLDGTITSGASSFDEAPVTGESVPQDKAEGSQVFGGTLNTNAAVEVLVTADEDCSTLARIVAMVQGAEAEKAPYEAFVDRFAEVYTPAVMVLAILLATVVPLAYGVAAGMEAVAWRDWVYRALSLLVVACPCALVISTPVSFVSAITRAARMGVLVKGGACFDIASKVDVVALDKTGTLTEGKPRVVDVRAFLGATHDGVLATAAALEANSTHPLARAVAARAAEAGCEVLHAEGVEELAGNGMRGTVDGVACACGKLAFAQDQGSVGEDVLAAVQELAGAGSTVLVVMAVGQAVGAIALADTIRESSRAALAQLKGQGVASLEMLTGDGRLAAEAVAAQAGVDRVSAELLPQGKVERLRALKQQGRSVCMVGDGINDAPALATADLGVTMGAAASDTALEVADVALLSDDLAQLPAFFRLSRRTMNVVRENVAFAIAVKLLIMVLVMAGVAGMGAAVFGDTGVALIVILNGMRLMTNWETKF